MERIHGGWWHMGTWIKPSISERSNWTILLTGKWVIEISWAIKVRTIKALRKCKIKSYSRIEKRL
jgi:hypothetical protein